MPFVRAPWWHRSQAATESETRYAPVTLASLVWSQFVLLLDSGLAEVQLFVTRSTDSARGNQAKVVCVTTQRQSWVARSVAIDI
jgi:hypothetical protein